MINLLSSLRVLRQPPKPEPKFIEINGKAVVLSFRRNARCRRMVLRLTPDGAGVAITLPLRASVAEALRFVENSKDWIIKTMAARAPTVAFSDGQCVSYKGLPHTIRATGGKRGLVSCADTSIIVPGDHAHVPRRLRDWFSAQAKSELTFASQAYAAAMGVKFRRLTLRDQNTRWGSCSASGDLSYSWRLILAPPHVLDYVAAHEVAHLKEMNHGPRFWRLVITHCKTAKESRRWLREHGRELHRYGVTKT
jgi:predicted metal-dependent hydrolase